MKLGHASPQSDAGGPKRVGPASDLVPRLTNSSNVGSVDGTAFVFVQRALLAITLICALAVSAALVDLAVRAALRLELRWDTFAYHLPFAALRGGLSIPYDMNDRYRPLYDGFPPLPDLAQGLLWKLTGSVNATGVVNYLAFVTFLGYCHVALRARFWLVGLISLTAPMVLIHTTVSYVDLFGNSLLAIGVASCLYLYLFPERASRVVMLGGLAGLAGAASPAFPPSAAPVPARMPPRPRPVEDLPPPPTRRAGLPTARHPGCTCGRLAAPGSLPASGSFS